MSYAIKINLTKSERSEDSLSHLLGDPIVPESLQERVNDLDGDVLFFGQIDFSQLKEPDPEHKLPHEGHLYLFLDTASYPYEAISFFSAEEPRVVLEDFNAEVTDFERFTQPFTMSFEQVAEDYEGTKLLGSATWEWGEEVELFLQYDPLDNDTGFLDFLDGYTFFVFGNKDKDPENLRFIIDRS